MNLTLSLVHCYPGRVIESLTSLSVLSSKKPSGILDFLSVIYWFPILISFSIREGS
jgi:hypothetical protein